MDEVVGRDACIAIFAGDSVLSESRLRGTFVREAESKTAEGTAFLYAPDERTMDALRPLVADPRYVLIDFEDLPGWRLPWSSSYVGGAFARIYGTVAEEAAPFMRYLGVGEVLEDEGQELMTFPPMGFPTEAKEIVRQAKRDLGLDLGFRLDAIPEAARAMEDVGSAAGDRAERLRLAFLWGSYLGECLVRELEGEWFDDPKLGGVVLLPRKDLPPAKVSPFCVAERILKGEGPALAAEWVERAKTASSSRNSIPPKVA